MSRQISLCILLMLSTAVIAQSQPSNSANKYFEQGNREYNRGDLDQAIADFTRAIEISSQPMHHKQGNDNLRAAANSFSTSEDGTSGITIIDPLTAHALNGRGVALLKKGNIEQALNDFERALRIQPNLVEAYVNHGGARFAQGDVDAALADWNKAIEIDPKVAAAYLNRGVALMQIGKVDDA